MGMQPGTGANFLQGGMQGLSQGLQNYGRPANQQRPYDFSQPQGFPQPKLPSKIKKPDDAPSDEDLFGDVFNVK